MRVEITTGERDLLMRMLDEHSRSLLYEIARADNREFRSGLQRELAQTDLLRARVSRAAEHVDYPVL